MTKVFSLISDFLLAATTLSFILGIGFSWWIPEPELLLWLFAGMTILMLAACYAFRLPKATLFSLLATFFLLGLLHGVLSNRPPVSPLHIYNLVQDKREAVLIGTLAAMVNSSEDNGQALIDLQYVRFSDKPEFQTTHGLLSLRLKTAWPADILPGTPLAVRADVQRPTGFNTPGGYDYPAHLARQGIWVTGYSRSPLFIHRVEANPSWLQTLRYFPEYLRHSISLHIDRTVAPPLQGVYRALLIGDQTKVDEHTRKLFRDSGCLHILSISGLHFAIIGSLLFLVVYWLLRRSEWLILHCDVKKLALAICLPILCFYALLAGLNAPVLRSLIMTCTAILALCVDRRKSIPTLLALAALLILLVNPQALFTISFQLSFVAIAAIAAVSPALHQFRGNIGETSNLRRISGRFWQWLAAAFSVSLVATLGTAPLVLLHFNQVSLVGPFANLVVEPLICLWSLPFALLSCLLMPFFPEASAFFLQMGSPGLSLSLKCMELVTALPLSTIWLATPHPILIITFYISFFYLLLSLQRKAVFPAGPVFLLAIFTSLFIFSPTELFKGLKKDLTITFLDVGQGNATLLEYPGGYRVLVDGGGSSSSTRQVGETLIAPFLWRKGITVVDQIIVTHPDADHYNGIPFIVQHFHPSLIWTNNMTGHDNPYAEFLLQATQAGVEVNLPENNSRLIVHNGGEISCLSNLVSGDEQKRKQGKEKENDEGLIVHSSFGKFSALFPGDISKIAEEKLIRETELPQVTVLLAAHHGSRTSNSDAFLETLQPRYLVVSAGKNRFGYFPHPGLAAQCRQQAITMLTTADDGAIEINTDGERFSLQRYRRAMGGPLPAKMVVEVLAENEQIPQQTLRNP